MQLQLCKIPFDCCINSVHSKIPIPPFQGKIVHSVNYTFFTLFCLETIRSANTHGGDLEAVIRGSKHTFIYVSSMRVLSLNNNQGHSYFQ